LTEAHNSILDTISALLSIFGDLTGLSADDQYLAQAPTESSEANNLTARLNDLRLMDSTLDLYRLFKTSQDAILQAKALHSGGKPSRQAGPFSGYFSKLAKLISNLTYLQTAHVERVFLHGDPTNIGLVLSNTRMDEHDPTLREWSLMIIRNLCQVSEGIRT